MYTKVQYFALVDRLLAKLSTEFGIEVGRRSATPADDYRTGDWFYEDVGSTFDIKIARWGINRDPVMVYGPKWDDEQTSFERKLENALRSAISRLLDF